MKGQFNEFLEISGRATTTQLKPLANALGYTKVPNQFSNNAAVWQNNNAANSLKFISYDQDSHIGGFWKAASSIEKLASDQTRTGTYNIDLTIKLGK